MTTVHLRPQPGEKVQSCRQGMRDSGPKRCHGTRAERDDRLPGGDFQHPQQRPEEGSKGERLAGAASDGGAKGGPALLGCHRQDARCSQGDQSHLAFVLKGPLCGVRPARQAEMMCATASQKELRGQDSQRHAWSRGGQKGGLQQEVWSGGGTSKCPSRQNH